MSYTEAHRQFYLKNGYVVVEGLVDPEDIQLISNRFSELQQAINEAGSRKIEHIVESGSNLQTQTKPAIRKFTDLAPNDALFRRIASLKAITDVVADLTGGDKVMLYSDQAMLKPALHGSAKPIHQDNSYFKITPDVSGITCWMAIDDATLENGCMRYIPGSQRLGRVNHKSIPGTPHLIPDGDSPLGEEVAVPIPAGTCIFHHLCVLHSSHANTSQKSRRSWSLHYANHNATSCVKPWSEMLSVR